MSLSKNSQILRNIVSTRRKFSPTPTYTFQGITIVLLRIVANRFLGITHPICQITSSPHL